MEDDDLVAESLARWLELEWEVRVELDPLSALSDVLRGASYEAILCDMGLGSISGVHFYRALCAIAPDQGSRVIFMTGGDAQAEHGAFLRETGRICLEKPFSPREVLELLRRFCERGE